VDRFHHFLIGSVVGAYLRLAFGDLLVIKDLPRRGTIASPEAP